MKRSVQFAAVLLAMVIALMPSHDLMAQKSKKKKKKKKGDKS
jgi:hypothetical protein